jgi:hypothetical protein
MRDRSPHRLLTLIVALAVPLQLSGCGATPPAAQSLPNMGTRITPLAPQGSTFAGLNPGLADNRTGLQGRRSRPS